MSLLTSERVSPATPADLTEGRARGPVTWRAVALGLIGVLLISGLTAYNDYVVQNTYFVGNYLPVGLLLLFVVFSLVINAPLLKVAPRMALSTGEIGVAFAMALVACGFPSSGLMRYLPANLVIFHQMASQNSDHAELLRLLNLPDWLFPTSAEKDPVLRANDPVIKYFVNRVPSLSTPAETSALWRTLLSAWLTPLLTWGALFACLLGMILCMVTIVRHQWSDNERLPFPLAGVFQSLIEQPEQGRTLNPLLRSPLFWVAFFSIFVIHSLNALHAFFPRYVPEFPREFNFFNVMGEPPLSYTEWYFKSQKLFFSVVGLVFFLQSAVSFSLWFFIVALQVVAILLGTFQMDYNDAMRADMNFGGLFAFVLSVLWVGRAHWVLVMRQMMRGPREGEPRGRYIPYPVAGWGMLACALGAMVFFKLAGCSWPGAAVIVVLLLMFFVAASRIVAETGIPFLQFNASLWRFWTIVFPYGVHTTARTFFFSSWMQGLLVHDMRESPAVFTSQALRVTDQTAYEGKGTWRRTWPLAACIVAALSIAFVTSGASMVITEYSYSNPLDRNGQGKVINPYAMDGTGQPKGILDPAVLYARNTSGSVDAHNPVVYFGAGAAFTAFLAFMRLRFTAWPFHPVGFLLMNTYPMRSIWFSVFIGWLAKSLTVRFGGIDLFRALRPLFLGMIVGEAGAVAFWLLVNLACVQLGYDYYQTSILPG